MNAVQPIDTFGNSLRVPPHNYEAERALLGAILMNNRAFERVSDFLEVKHFSDPANGRIYGVIKSLLDKGQQATIVTLKPYLEADAVVVAAGGMKHLAAIAASVVTVINAIDYGRQIFDQWKRRELIAIGDNLINAAFDPKPDESAQDVIETTEAQLYELSADDAEDWAADLADEYEAAVDRWAAHDRGEISGLSSGLIDEDDAAGLMGDGDLVILGGRPGHCKTTKVRGTAYHAAVHFKAAAERLKTKPRQVVFFSSEMSRAQLTDCYMSGLTGIPAPRQRKRILDDSEWRQIAELRPKLNGLPIHIVSKPAPTLGFIRAVCRRMQKRGGVGLIIVDYLQIMGLERDVALADRNNQVGYLARGLKETAKLFNCPVIALSQLSRAVEKREDKRPNMADLRDSGEIEAAADTIQLLYRPLYYVEQEKPVKRDSEDDEAYSKKYARWAERCEQAQGILEVIVGKARFGEAGKGFTLHVDLERGWVENHARNERL